MQDRLCAWLVSLLSARYFFVSLLFLCFHCFGQLTTKSVPRWCCVFVVVVCFLCTFPVYFVRSVCLLFGSSNGYDVQIHGIQCDSLGLSNVWQNALNHAEQSIQHEIDIFESTNSNCARFTFQYIGM